MQTTSLDKKTVPELKKLCKSKGIRPIPKTKKLLLSALTTGVDNNTTSDLDSFIDEEEDIVPNDDDDYKEEKSDSASETDQDNDNDIDDDDREVINNSARSPTTRPRVPRKAKQPTKKKAKTSIQEPPQEKGSFFIVYKDGIVKSLSSFSDVQPFMNKGFLAQQFNTKQELMAFKIKYKALKQEDTHVPNSNVTPDNTPTKPDPASPDKKERTQLLASDKCKGVARSIAEKRGDAIPVHYIMYPDSSVLLVTFNLEMKYRDNQNINIRNMFRFRPQVMVPTIEEFLDRLPQVQSIHAYEVRAKPYSDDDAARFNPNPPTAQPQGTIWNDEALVFLLNSNPTFEETTTVVETFIRQLMKLIQSPEFKECLVAACRSYYRSGNLHEQLQNDTDYFWQFLNNTKPRSQPIVSLDARLRDQAIEKLFCILPSKKYIGKPERSIPKKVKLFFYRSGVLSPDIQILLQDPIM